jgi:hypothetical protein
MMKIRFIRPATAVGFGYRENETADLPPESANKLIEMGYAVLIEQKEEQPETRESKAAPEVRGRKKRR